MPSKANVKKRFSKAAVLDEGDLILLNDDRNYIDLNSSSFPVNVSTSTSSDLSRNNELKEDHEIGLSYNISIHRTNSGNESEQDFDPQSLPAILLENNSHDIIQDSKSRTDGSISPASDNGTEPQVTLSKKRSIMRWALKDYNSSLKKLDIISAHQQQRENKLKCQNFQDESATKHRCKIFKFLGKKTSNRLSFALPDFKLQEIEKLITVLDNFDKSFGAAEQQEKSVSKKASFESSSLLSGRSFPDIESRFQEYHSRNLDIGAKVRQSLEMSELSDLSYDLIIEHERGLILFGYPLFSKNTLVQPVDPYPFINQYNKTINIAQDSAAAGCFAYDMKLYPIDANKWEWKWDKWYVLMLDHDIDDQGWIYSGLTFSNRHWRGKYRFGNSVRKRFWIRIKEKKLGNSLCKEILSVSCTGKNINKDGSGHLMPSPSHATNIDSRSNPFRDIQNFFDELHGFRLDRLKIEFIIATFFDNNASPHVRNLRQQLLGDENYFEEMLNSLVFPESLRILRDKFVTVSTNQIEKNDIMINDQSDSVGGLATAFLLKLDSR